MATAQSTKLLYSPAAGTMPDWLFPTTVTNPKDITDKAPAIPGSTSYDVPSSTPPTTPPGTVPSAPTIADITTGAKTITDPTGAFDVFMQAGMAHIQKQYDEGRIKGKEYADAIGNLIVEMMDKSTGYVAQLYTAEALAAKLGHEIDKARNESDLIRMQAVESRYKSDLLLAQIAELKENGVMERTLKKSQVQVQTQQAQLYTRQIKGFDDKARNDTLKITMDAWAIHSVEVDDTNGPMKELYGSATDELIKKAVKDVGL